MYIELTDVNTKLVVCLPVGSFRFTVWEEGGSILTLNDGTVLYINEPYEYIIAAINSGVRQGLSVIRLPEEDDDDFEDTPVSLVNGEYDENDNLINLKFTPVD